MPQTRQLILASRSPRRRQLLADAGWKFQVIAPREDIENEVDSSVAPRQLVQRLAFAKAQNVASAAARTFVAPWIVLAADTLAEIDQHALGKPRDIEHARAMLRLLSGREHDVHTGICLWPQNRSAITDVATTRLRMDQLTDEQIESYLDTNKWRGKAGAFGYQDGWDWLHVISGEESNVVGLPLPLLDEMYAKLEVASAPDH